MPDDLLIHGATVVTMDGDDRVLDPGWILVRDGAIESVGAGEPAGGAETARLDGTGCVALPGLVNAHTHLFQTLIRGLYDGLPFLEWLRRIYHVGLGMTDEDWRMSAALGAAESVRGGVTTIFEHQFLHRGTAWSEAIIDGARSIGVRLILARTAMDEGELAPADALETPAVALAAVDALIEAHRSDIDAGVLRILGGPNTPGVSASAELSVAAARHARDRGLRLAMHVAESTAAVDRVREATGRTGVVDWLDHLDALPPGTVAAHCVHLTAAEIGLLAGRSVAVAHNPVSNLYLGDGIAPVPELLDAGVTVGLGTDGAASNDTQDLWEAMKVAALIQRVRPAAPRWLKPGEILRMATIGGAKAIGMEERIGSLEAGKRADVTLVRVGHAPHAATVHDVLAHLVFVARSLDVATVLIDGQVVVRDGRLTTVDAPALASAAQDRGRALAGRLATLG